LSSVRRHAPRIIPAAALLILLGLLLSGCETDTPQNTFDAQGEVAKDQRDLFYVAMWPAIVIMIGVLGACVVLALRFREKDPNSLPPKQIHGNTRLEMMWTILPALLMLGMAVPMVAMIYEQGEDPDEDAYYIDVTAQRYSFTFEYPDIVDDQGRQLFVPAEPHIPAGREVVFRLHAADVIHSFWLPKLGGKLDVVPGETNVLVLKADAPGTIHGQCAEYCGLDHANMTMIVHVDSEEDFAAWVEEQSAPPPAPANGDDGEETEDGG